jgi:hypothetical protein
MIAFWTWLWGPIGLLLATPLTVCLAVMGKHVPAVGFLSTLLGDRPALSPAIGFYQRLIAGDEDEASDIAEAHLEEHALVATFDSLLIPALTSAKREVQSGTLSAAEQGQLIATTRQIAEELVIRRSVPGSSADAAPKKDREGSARGASATEASATEASATKVSATEASAIKVRVLAIAARDESDQAALGMLEAALHERGLDPSRVELHVSPAIALVSEVLAQVDELAPAIACIVALPPGGGAQAKLLCLRLRTRHPDLKIVVGRWGWVGESDQVRSQLLQAGATEFGASLAETCSQIGSLRSQGIAMGGTSSSADAG